MSRAIATAIIVPGKVTQRVSRVIRPHREAVELLARADAIAAARATNPDGPVTEPAPVPKPSSGRRARRVARGHRLPPRHASRRRYVVLAVSTYRRDLAALDAAVDRVRAAGARRANRSWLIRVAIARLDLDAVIAAERKHLR